MGGRADAAAIGREVKEHQGHTAVFDRGLAQRDEPSHAGGEHLCPLWAGHHVLWGGDVVELTAAVAALTGLATNTRATPKDHGAGGAIELGNGHHDGGLDWHEPAVGAAPVGQRLELEGMGCQVGHVERGEDVLGGLRIVVGRATHQ